jgi:phosphoribosylglycinamide formyltransferase-1
VLASGSGTNLQALIDNPEVGPRIVLVVSDRADAGALGRADAAGIPTAVTPYDDHPDRDSFSVALADAVEGSGAKGVVLAGFMRVLSSSFIDRFPGRILNVHPSLLPAFPGPRPVALALAHGARVTGVTVHFVDEQVDHGPIIAQEAVAVELADTVDTLHARIQTVEHRLYPEIVRLFVTGDLYLDGSKVVSP